MIVYNQYRYFQMDLFILLGEININPKREKKSIFTPM